MLTSTVHIIVITTLYSNERLLVHFRSCVHFGGLCVQTTVSIDDPTGLRPFEAYDVSCVRIHIVLRTCNRRGSLLYEYGVAIPAIWTVFVNQCNLEF
jgi:hypothetical protein